MRAACVSFLDMTKLYISTRHENSGTASQVKEQVREARGREGREGGGEQRLGENKEGRERMDGGWNRRRQVDEGRGRS